MERIASTWERVRQTADGDDAQTLYALFETAAVHPHRFAEPGPRAGHGGRAARRERAHRRATTNYTDRMMAS